jgi:hypothetical protein
MKNLIIIMALIVTIFVPSAVRATEAETAKADGLRIAWISKQVPSEKILQIAQELNFYAIIVYWNKNKTPQVIERAKKFNFDTYTWIFPLFPKGKKEQYKQQMNIAENVIFKAELAMAKKKKLFPAGYQGGGEPILGNKEVMLYEAPCFHHPEVVELLKKQIKEILTTAPNLKGIALDMFGYQNYHCCYCPTSMKAFADYCTKHPKLTKFEAWPKFNFESLVNFQNELCEYARSIRPSVKITNHVWPVYQPKPLYGNRLKLDYCAQTVAWFFKPFWSDDKIINYTKTVINDADKYYPQQQGIPFLGYFNNWKSPERVAHELDLIFTNSPAKNKSIAIYNFNHLKNELATIKAMKAVFKQYHIIGEVVK